MPNWKLSGSELVEDADAPAASEPKDETFDPGEHTIDEVKAHIAAYPDDVQSIYDAELAGKARKTLLDWLTEG